MPQRPSRRALTGALLLIACAGAATLAIHLRKSPPASPPTPPTDADVGGTAGSSTTQRSGSDAESGASAPPDPSVHRRIRLGRSVLGRQILAFELGDRDASRPLLVVGCIHGDEHAGIGVTRRLERGPPPRESQLWVVNDLNPDGVAADTRQNANLVDLNRNFPWRWRPLGKPGDQQYSGTRQLSEPESRIAASLVLRLRPRITIWFHQPLGVTDESGGRPGVERRFAALTGLPLRRLVRYPGSAAGWQNHRLPSSTAFVSELPPGRLAASRVNRYARAVRGLAPRGS